VIDANSGQRSLYSSWERRLNAKSNGLLRQCVRKATDLRTDSDKQVIENEQH